MIATPPVPASSGVPLEGRYRLDTPIAAGGMGEVWRATDLVLDRPVAVKMLRPGYAGHEEDLARFRAEAQHAGLLSHPGIAKVYDYHDGDPPYLVMELVDGPSLARLLDDGPVDPALTMSLIAQAARALQAAHAAGLVHRDVKPGNMLISRGRYVKITDFGIAHAVDSAPLTRPGVLMGTPGYLAPERAAGRPATPAADLYALGIVAHQCLTGEVPFHGEPLAVALAHQDQPLPPLPSSVPADVAALVADLTAKDPSARPASAGAAAKRAEHVLAALTAPGTVRRRRHDRQISGLATRAALALAALIVIATAGWVATGLRGPAPQPARPGPSAAVQRPRPHGSHPPGRVAPADRTGGVGPASASGQHHRSRASRQPSAPGTTSAPSQTPTPSQAPAPTTTATPTGTPAPTGTAAPSGTPGGAPTPAPSASLTGESTTLSRIPRPNSIRRGRPAGLGRRRRCALCRLGGAAAGVASEARRAGYSPDRPQCPPRLLLLLGFWMLPWPVIPGPRPTWL
jgi:serine/threonine-protein kinase